MAKFTVTVDLPRSNGPSSVELGEVDLDFLGLTSDMDADAVGEAVATYIAENISAEKYGSAYDITVCVKATYSFTFEDEEGEYEDEAAVEQAVSYGDIDYTNFVSIDCPDDVEVYEVEASEA